MLGPKTSDTTKGPLGHRAGECNKFNESRTCIAKTADGLLSEIRSHMESEIRSHMENFSRNGPTL